MAMVMARNTRRPHINPNVPMRSSRGGVETWDDTLMFDAVPQNGHKAGTSRAR
jgi:hypothetical protein